jgi:hypothetical protein
MSYKNRILANTQQTILWRSSQAIAVLMMFLVPLQSMAQVVDKPDSLIEAALYDARARDQMKCSLEDAERWCKKALETGRRFRTSDRAERDMAGAFIARSQMLLVEIRGKRQQMHDVSNVLGKLIDDNRLQSANRLLAENKDLACQPLISSIKSELRLRISNVQSLIERGDRMVNVDPREALRFYEQARKADREHPELASKIEAAKQAKRMMPHVSAGKVIGISILLAGLGAAAYYGHEEYEKQKQFKGTR